ncbi:MULTISPECIES: cell wall-active antibiotics response protein LiaF [unclassified Solibacillus]|uniref:cell wall-active antibiotics response protein LiaF n=1 Tax=unclassified Solibacillus TaxID=2637870 RepID=UPI0030F6E6C7
MPKITSDQLTIIVISMALVVLIELTLFNNISVFLLIVGAILLFYSFKKKKQYTLWAGLILIFFAVIHLWTLRLFIIGTLIFLLYQYLTKKEQIIEIKQVIDTIGKNKLIGTTGIPTESYQWRDIHIQRFIGDITVDTTETILPHGKSIIVINQSLGKVRITVPYEISLQLHYSTIYGEANCLHFSPKQCINEQLYFEDGDPDAKRVLVLYVTTWIGDVEVQRG